MGKLSEDESKTRRLRRLLVLFFLALLLPTGALLLFAADQMKWETYHQFRQQAESLTSRIDSRIVAATETENIRKSTDYRFLVFSQDRTGNSLRLSPLAQLPGRDSLPGLIGHFQIEANGTLTSPLLPEQGISQADHGLNDSELKQRQAITRQLREILISGKVGQISSGESSEPNLPSATVDAERGDLLASAEEPRFENELATVTKSEKKQSLRKDALSRFDKQTDNAYRQNSQRIGSVADLKLDERLEQRAVDSDSSKSSDEIAAITGNRAPIPQRRRKEKLSTYDLEKILPQAKSNAGSSFAFDDSVEAADESSTLRAGDKLITAPPAVLEQIPAEIQTNREQRSASTQQAKSALLVTSFESEVDPFKLAIFDDEHIVFYRNVWRRNERIIQGAVVHRETFIDAMIRQEFASTPLANMSQLLVAFNDDVLNIFGATKTVRYASSTESLTGSVLYRSKLAEPFNHFSLIFNIADLPAGAGMQYLLWVTAALLCILFGGCYFMYRFGKGQIALNKQQQDFVSAVSHELKTPLTSIRMYSEMLKNSWASDDKKPAYYEYIHSESERLSRLIENVLQLARIDRNQSELKLEATNMGELMANALSKIASIIEATSFNINQQFNHRALESEVMCSQDATLQILINIVDNALKFSRDADKKQIDIRLDKLNNGSIEIGIRDYGPGIDQTQMKKIFELFYRTENELTRETVGTGIGLALVHQLASAMGARIDARNCQPGVEFTLTWPSAAGQSRSSQTRELLQ